MKGQIMETPVGMLTLLEELQGICGIHFGEERSPDIVMEETPLLAEAKRQLGEYFSGARKEFHLPLSIHGTLFQKHVWKALCTIPYGGTRTYGQIAAQIGKPGGSRAVGMANHKNPIAIVIPCHRVQGAGGALTGYAGGLHRKRALLELEGAVLNNGRRERKLKI